jgi:hypothetical protein
MNRTDGKAGARIGELAFKIMDAAETFEAVLSRRSSREI